MVNMDNIEEKLHIVWENISDGLKQQYGKKYLNYCMFFELFSREIIKFFHIFLLLNYIHLKES